MAVAMMQFDQANALEDLEGLPELAALRAKVGHLPMRDETRLPPNHKRSRCAEV